MALGSQDLVRPEDSPLTSAELSEVGLIETRVDRELREHFVETWAPATEGLSIDIGADSRRIMSELFRRYEIGWPTLRRSRRHLTFFKQ